MRSDRAVITEGLEALGADSAVGSLWISASSADIWIQRDGGSGYSLEVVLRSQEGVGVHTVTHAPAIEWRWGGDRLVLTSSTGDCIGIPLESVTACMYRPGRI